MKRDFTKSSDDMGLTLQEAADAILKSALEHGSTREWTNADDNMSSCMTVRVPVALLRRMREAIERPQA